MGTIERISSKIAREISKNLEFDKSREEVIAYGAFNILHTLWSTLLLIIAGLLTGMLMEVLIISMTAALLRQFSGGVHASSPGRCSTVTVVTFVFLSFMVRNLGPLIPGEYYILLFQAISSFFVIIILHQKCPVDTPSKPIRDKDHKKLLRKRSFLFFTFTQIIMVLLWLLYFKYSNERNISEQLLRVIISVQTGLIWQSFLLTGIGRNIIEKLDRLLGKISLHRR